MKESSNRWQADCQQDDLQPQFARLTNDDDREKKAAFRKAGTYHVIVNPESFKELDQYRDLHSSPSSTSSKDPASSVCDRFNADLQLHHDHGQDSNDTETSNDPDVVILRVFEDDSKKLLSPSGVVGQSRSLKVLSPSDPAAAISTYDQDYSDFPEGEIASARQARQNGHDDHLLQHYTNFVHRHLAQVHRDSLGTSLETGALTAPDVFEQQAALFPPVCQIPFILNQPDVLFF